MSKSSISSNDPSKGNSGDLNKKNTGGDRSINHGTRSTNTNDAGSRDKK